MKAHVGDRLIVDGEGDRVGLVIGVQHEDGTPPYVIKWLSDGHVALVFPGPYARIIPSSHSLEDGIDAAGRRGNHSTGIGNHSANTGNHTGTDHNKKDLR
ncbi:MAG: DUF1918 domain-containing protein [Micromonosporaceae bacterium]